MTIKEAQKLVDDWINTTGVRYFNELTNMAILTEEVGEVARIMARKYGEQSFKESDKQPDLAALKQNMKKKSIRDHDRHRRNKKLQPKTKN